MSPPFTPIEIALLAMLHESFERHPPKDKKTRHPGDFVAAWGSWQLAAKRLAAKGLLQYLGTEAGTREMEWRTLKGRHRRGKPGRSVHLYRLERRAAPLAARCAWAVARLPAGRGHATWKDVPEAAPSGGVCPSCGCTPLRPCAVVLAGGCGSACCAPAGLFGAAECSACAA